jgi:hypothetical protein
MIRMIANNTSDYVAIDLIHHLWCQHDETYGKQYPKWLPHMYVDDFVCLYKHKNPPDLNNLCNGKICVSPSYYNKILVPTQSKIDVVQLEKKDGNYIA